MHSESPGSAQRVKSAARIPERIAARAHVQVDHCDWSQGRPVEDHIVEHKVGMDQAWRCVRRPLAPQQRDGFGKGARICRIGDGRAARHPPFERRAKKSGRAIERLKLDCAGATA
jgi:hypothetical protein